MYLRGIPTDSLKSRQSKAALPSLISTMLCLFLFFKENIFHRPGHSRKNLKRGMGDVNGKQTDVNGKQTHVHFLWRNFLFCNGVTVAFYFGVRRRVKHEDLGLPSVRGGYVNRSLNLPACPRPCSCIANIFLPGPGPGPFDSWKLCSDEGSVRNAGLGPVIEAIIS